MTIYISPLEFNLDLIVFLNIFFIQELLSGPPEANRCNTLFEDGIATKGGFDNITSYLFLGGIFDQQSDSTIFTFDLFNLFM